MLLGYIEAKRRAGKDSTTLIGAPVVKTGRIVPYRTRIGNTTNESYLTRQNHNRGFPRITNASNILKLGNASLRGGAEYFRYGKLEILMARGMIRYSSTMN